MDIKKCKLFVITAETKQISKTAKLTGYTQSAVSHMLKSLEKEVGIELFKRDRYGVHLTSLGADFLFYVKRFLAENERLEQFVYDLHGLEVGSIKVGSYTSVSTAALPEIVKVFHESHPNVDIAIKEGGSDDIENWIADYEVDLGFCSKRPAFAFDFNFCKSLPFPLIVIYFGSKSLSISIPSVLLGKSIRWPILASIV